MSASDFAHRLEPATVSGAPTLLLLHGTGGNEEDLLPLGRTLVPGAALLSPRGRVLEQGMPRFFRRLAEGVFDVADLVARTHELADWVAAAARRYDLDPTRVTAVGFSNGANVAASMLLLRPRVLAGAVLFRAMVPLEPECLPTRVDTRVFLGSGRADPIVPIENAERLAALLRRAGADVTQHWAPAGHALTPEEVRAAAAWLREGAWPRRGATAAPRGESPRRRDA